MCGEKFGAITVVGVSTRCVDDGDLVTGGAGSWVRDGSTVGSEVLSGTCVRVTAGRWTVVASVVCCGGRVVDAGVGGSTAGGTTTGTGGPLGERNGPGSSGPGSVAL
jgi:hypothetical protein